MNPRHLYRCRSDRRIAGVAAGMAEYLEVDPTVVRILWILSAFIGGFSILLYVILAFVIPLEPIETVAYATSGGAGVEGGAGGEHADGVTDAGTWQAGEPTSHGPVPAMPAHGHAHAVVGGDARGGGGGAWLVVGVLLVVFGGLAFLGEVVPGWASAALGPAFVLALGVALIVGAMRRQATQG